MYKKYIIIIYIINRIYSYKCLILLLLFLYMWSPFIPSFHPRNLDEVFTYNHMALMSLRNQSHVKASMVLTRGDHLFIYNYIRS